MLRILGIDPGSRVMGYAVLTSGEAGLRYVECGVVTADREAPLEQRLAEISRGLAEVVAELAPDVVAMEDIFTCKNARTALALGQARGAALAACGMAGLTVHAYAPSLVKVAVTGRGNATKQQVAHMVSVLIGLKKALIPDAADALAVAVAHAHIRKDREFGLKARLVASSDRRKAGSSPRSEAQATPSDLASACRREER